MRIDWHSHVWRSEHLEPEWGPELDANVLPAPAPSTLGHYQDHIEAMDEAGVDVAIVLALVSCHVDLEIPNEYVAGFVEQNPTRAIGFASVDPSDPQAVDKLRYAATDLGLKGLKLSPPYQGFHPHSPEAFRIYQVAADLGLVITFHQGGVFLRRGFLEFASPALLDKVARSFPQMKIIVAHMGQPWVPETVAVMFKNPNVFADLSARYGRPWQLYQIMMNITDYGVTDRILFGSDFPIYRPAVCLEQFRALGEVPTQGLPPLDPAIIDGIIENRPLELLGLSLPDPVAKTTGPEQADAQA
jgi:predicted TIM-barrel fold metal-dependent hydrolase